MGNFKFDSKKLEKQITKDLRRETQQFFDSFSRRYKGKPLATVKAALSREWKSKMNGTMTDPELTDYATAISEGASIKIK